MYLARSNLASPPRLVAPTQPPLPGILHPDRIDRICPTGPHTETKHVESDERHREETAKKAAPALADRRSLVAVGIVLASGGLVTAIQLENRNTFVPRATPSLRASTTNDRWRRRLTWHRPTTPRTSRASNATAGRAPPAAWMRSPAWRPRYVRLLLRPLPQAGHHHRPAWRRALSEVPRRCDIPAGLQQPFPCLPVEMAGPGAEGCGNLRGVPPGS